MPPAFPGTGIVSRIARRRCAPAREASWIAAAIAALSLHPAAVAAATDAETGSVLERYVAAPDSSFAWTEVSSGRVGGARYVELILTSQTWRGIPWKHQLVILLPRDPGRDHHQGFLFVHSGRWRAEYEQGWSGPMPSAMRLFARLAETIGAPVGVLRQVPHQPLFGRTEDRLIAYTFDRFLETGDESWPLLLPMVKSVARGMDAMQQLTANRWNVRLDRFTVAGASKRGWTAWLAVAVDPRVNAVAPMVIDMLDIPAQIAHQRATFGELSEQVRDYAAINLPERVATPNGRRLMDIVDPYRYRDRLRQAKLIVLGTNDRYWPLDALNLYWDGLAQPKHVFYAPNQGHSVRDYDALIRNLAALHRHAARGMTLPAMAWEFTAGDAATAVTLRTDRRAARVRLWRASAATRDFRDARWKAAPCRRRGDAWRCPAVNADGAFTALFAEAEWRDRGEPPYTLSTTVCIREGGGEVRGACLGPALRDGQISETPNSRP